MTLDQMASDYADSMCPGSGARDRSWIRTRDDFKAGFTKARELAAKVVHTEGQMWVCEMEGVDMPEFQIYDHSVGVCRDLEREIRQLGEE